MNRIAPTEIDTRLQQVLPMMEQHAATLGEDGLNYWIYHRNRFAWISRVLDRQIQNLRAQGRELPRLLDIGCSFQTQLFKKLNPLMTVDTLGFDDSRYRPDGPSRHIQCDLNVAVDPEQWPPAPEQPYDIITMLEVIEHLYTAPSQVLPLLKRFLVPGGILLIQTPNAVALYKRLQILAGRNPYEKIRESRLFDPGHFREYTAQELIDYGRQSGLEAREVHLSNYWKSGRRMEEICFKASNFLPSSFRSGITIAFEAR